MCEEHQVLKNSQVELNLKYTHDKMFSLVLLFGLKNCAKYLIHSDRLEKCPGCSLPLIQFQLEQAPAPRQG